MPETKEVLTHKMTVTDVLARLPDADRPGGESKFTGPSPKVVSEITKSLIDGGQPVLDELLRRCEAAADAEPADYKPLYALHILTIHVSESPESAERERFCRTLGRRVTSDETPVAAKRDFVRELQFAGAEESVKWLARSLADEAVCEEAAEALVAIGAPARKALREGLQSGAVRCRPAVALALGRLRDGDAVEALQELAQGEDAAARQAATWALANIGKSRSVDVVLAAADRAAAWERIQGNKACLLLAERLAEAGEAREARRIYQHLKKTRKGDGEKFIAELATKALKEV